MTLRKWRSSSKQVLDTIPDELKEKDGLHINSDATPGAKALGVFWNTHNDTLHVSLGLSPSPSKREIASSAAKVFDVLGWFAPAVVWVKVILQRIWELGIDWDQPVPDNLSSSWDQWRKELPCILSKSIPRRLFCEGKEILDVQLHGFTDASTTAYGGVFYLRTRYADTTISVSLLTAKTRVAPLKKLTIPKLELCGALLTTKLLKSVAQKTQPQKANLRQGWMFRLQAFQTKLADAYTKLALKPRVHTYSQCQPRVIYTSFISPFQGAGHQYIVMP